MAFELQFLDYIQTIHTPYLDRIMTAVSFLGDKGLVWIVLVLILLAIPKTRPAGKVLVLALAVEILLTNLVLKPMIGRERPYVMNPSVELLIRQLSDYSFPSGHTGMAFAMVSGLYFAGRKGLAAVSLLAAALMAFSRMYLYVHYPTDILAGIAIGFLSGWAGNKLYHIINHIYDKKMNLKKDIDNTDKRDRPFSHDRSE
ncbi:MAG: phosphatase PAP2 family protein [Eubacterium sp.]|nr:phosphatase PAP2 family protein [Eubacterium sp.]